VAAIGGNDFLLGHGGIPPLSCVRKPGKPSESSANRAGGPWSNIILPQNTF
jgi:hypothetical protein